METLEGEAGETSTVVAAMALTDAEQQREVIRYLRLEKQIAENNLEAAEKEVVRWKQQANHCLRARDEAQALLQAERHKVNERQQERQSLVDQTRDYERLTLLQESNNSLREQYNAAVKSVEQHKLRITALEEEVAPLRRTVTQHVHTIAVLEEEKANKTDMIAKYQARIQNIMERFQTVDPKEYERVKQLATDTTNQLHVFSPHSSSLCSRARRCKRSMKSI